MIEPVGFLLIVPSALVVAAVTLIVYARWHRGTLEALGIPVVEPHWLLGSNWNYMNLNHHREDVKRSKTLGPVYGVYNGRTPEVFVSDLESIHRILFKDSHHFQKIQHEFGHSTVTQPTEQINGEKWKEIKSSISPLFTSSKLKTILGPLQRLCDDHVGALVEGVKNNGGQMKVEIAKFLGPFGVEVHTECLFGVKLKDSRSKGNAFVDKMRIACWEDLKFDWTYNIKNVFPFLNWIIRESVEVYDYFDSVIKSMIDQREKSGIKIVDTVNTLLEMRQKLNTKEYKRIGMNLGTVYGQAFQFYVAGFFGVNTVISHLFYNLATNPEVQRKLREEVDGVLNDRDDLNTLEKFPYLTGCLLETLRKNTSFHRVERVCTKDWEFKGWKIKKGMNVFIPMRVIHLDPEIHPEPEEFKPERFLPENKDQMHPCGFLAFGLGHRSCLGQKFMLEVLKNFMVKVIQNFEIKVRDDTVWNENPGNHYFLQLDPIYVDLVARNI